MFVMIHKPRETLTRHLCRESHVLIEKLQGMAKYDVQIACNYTWGSWTFGPNDCCREQQRYNCINVTRHFDPCHP